MLNALVRKSMSEKLEVLIKRMLADPSSERIAFKTLGERDDRAKFLEPLKQAGLFEASRNPGPRPAEQAGYTVIPFWSALEFLERVAQVSRAPENRKHAETVLQILKDVTWWRDSDEKPVDNYHTWTSFAEILASLPLDLLSTEAMRMLEVWLASRFDNGLVANALGSRLLPSILESDLSTKCELARAVITAVTMLRPKPRRGKGDDDDLETVVDGHHLREIFERNVGLLGKECGELAIAAIADAARRLWDVDRRHPTYWRRPAIEEHEQNKHRDEVFAAITTALRDVILHFADVDVAAVKRVLGSMLAADVPLHRRIALHVIDVRYQQYRALFWRFIRRNTLLDLEVRHELYWLLRNNFKHFTTSQRKRLLSLIKAVRAPKKKGTSLTHRAQLTLRIQRDWLHAIQGQGDVAVDAKYEKLVETVGRPGKHPDLLSYVETRTGPGPSPFPLDRLLSEECGDLVLLLNGFQEQKGWEQPTLRALVQVLQEAVSQKPEKFAACLRDFAELRLAYKYAVIEGFRKAVQNQAAPVVPPLPVLDFIRRELRGKQLWDEAKEVDPEAAGLMNPTFEWVLSASSDFIADVVKNDQVPLAASFAAKGIEVLGLILEKMDAEAAPDDANPLDRAINTARGRAIEGLFGCALRVERDSARAQRAHGEGWRMIERVVERELSKAKDGRNYEFIAIVGSMLLQLWYLNREWIKRQLLKVFDVKEPAKFRAAIVGFSYLHHFQKDIYLLLRENGVLTHALHQQFKESHVREKILQFIGIAYLHEDEKLEDPASLFRQVVDGLREDDLVELTGFFWAQRADLANQKPLVVRILEYWSYCHGLLRDRESQYGRVLSKLCLLAEYLPELTEKSLPLLLQASPYVDVDYNGTFLLQELHRLIPTNPELGGQVVMQMFTKYRPTYEDKDVVTLVEVLYQVGQKHVADQICNAMKDFPKVRALYLQRNP